MIYNSNFRLNLTIGSTKKLVEDVLFQVKLTKSEFSLFE